MALRRRQPDGERPVRGRACGRGLRAAGRDAARLRELGGRLLGLAGLPEREAELVMDLLEVGRARPFPIAQLERAPRRSDGLRGPVEGELATAEVIEVEGARLATRRGLERRQRLGLAPGLEQSEAQLIVRQRVLGRQL